MKVFIAPIIVVVTAISQLTGCAGSASHKVVSANQSGDTDLSCKSIETELVKTQIIIDDVNKDKEDISGADVVDGILWFPFNLIAKNSNYNSAIEAADRRIDKLQELKKDNNCSTQDSTEITVEANKLSDELKKLASLHKDGLLSNEEYTDAKQKVLDRF